VRIQVGEKYLITSDPLNVIVNQRYEKQKDGQPSGEYDFKAIAFCKNLEAACIYLFEKELNVADAENLSELMSVIINVKRDIQASMEIMKDEEIKKLQQKIRDQNKMMNDIKSLSLRCDNQGRSIETYELFEVMSKEGA
jgi:head-tail adaptor